MTNPRPRGGRPSSLDQPYDQTRTIAERIIELMATGAHVDTAAASVGITRQSLHEWLRIGAQTRTAILTGRRADPDDPNRDPDLPVSERHATRCMRFSDAVDAAQAEWLLRQEATLEAAVRPRQRRIVTRTTDSTGALASEQTRDETLEPDLATLRWRLERHPASRDTYGRTTTAVELSGPGGEGIPLDVRTSALADKIAALRDKRTEQSDPEGDPHAEPE